MTVQTHDSLHPSMQNLLQILINARGINGGWVYSKHINVEAVPYQHRKFAQQRGLIDARGKTADREFRINAKGLEAMGIIDATTESPRIANYTLEQKQRLLNEAKARIRAKQDSNTVNADFFRDLVAVLEKQVPGVKELVAAYKQNK